MATGPKWSRAALDVINNTYVIRNGLLYEYYPISVLPYKETDGFMRLEISPGVMAPGIAIVGKQLFEVSLDDLLRRKINVSKKHRSAADDNIGSKLPTKKSKGSKSTETNPVKQRLGTVSGDEVGQNADMAWENQVDTTRNFSCERRGRIPDYEYYTVQTG
jgi:hypothetical protein